MKTSELTGAALDYAVAKCSDIYVEVSWSGCIYCFDPIGQIQDYKPSTDWSQGGPIIEREEIGLKRNAPCSVGREWEASPSITAKGAGGKYGYGPTPLIAAIRCYVVSKLGDEVEIPEKLT